MNYIRPLSFFIIILGAGCLSDTEKGERSTFEETPQEMDGSSALSSFLHPLPYAFTEDGEALYAEKENFHLKDYLSALNALSVLATVSRASEYGHEVYQPDWTPEKMWSYAEQWLALLGQTNRMFNQNGRFPATVTNTEDREDVSPVDLSLYPNLAYAYHIHHRSGRFSGNPQLENRLNREASLFLTAPGRYLLRERLQENTFSHEDGLTDYRSLSYGLGGLHGTAYAWVSWGKPDGEDDMGTLTEDHLRAFLGIGPRELAGIYRAVDDYLSKHWSDELSIYVFPDGETEWSLSALGALLRGKKAMGDVLYMFGEEEDKERSFRTFERTAAILDHLFPLAKSWGMPKTIVFESEGPSAGSEVVDLHDWYAFLNHLGGGYALDREREGTARYFRKNRPDILDTLKELADQALLGVKRYHLTGHRRLVTSVNYENGDIVDPQLTFATMAMFITTAGNLYAKGSAFAPPGSWDEVGEEIANRSRRLFDLSFEHWSLLQQ